MKKEDLRIVFMGTPEFAVESLKRLVEGGYNVVAVVTQPDKPVGRHGSVLQPTPVKEYALSQGLPVLQPEKMKDPAFLEQLRGYDANLQVVVAFRMLPEVVWAMPAYGTFNVHAALLPQYRGAAPINWAVINGETQTGVTTFFLDHDIDTGRVIEQRTFDIPDEADVEFVYDGLMHLGAEICLSTIEKIIAADGRPASVSQEEMTASDASEILKPAPKLFKENTRIDWNQEAKRVYDFVRGLSPYPGAWTILRDGRGKESVLKLYRTEKTGEEIASAANANNGMEIVTGSGVGTAAIAPGTLRAERKQLFVACKDRWLRITDLQLAGKKRMDTQAFLNGLQGVENYTLVSLTCDCSDIQNVKK